MTLRETITEELLNAVEHPEQLENISRNYSRSKGPYYAALLDATNQLQDQLDELLEEISPGKFNPNITTLAIKN